MGGNVAWTVRLSDGTEYRMDRWTNIFPDVINDAFLNEEPNAINEALKVWLEMKADWEQNKDTGDYQHNMTEVYAPYPYGTMPSEYGIITVDFTKKRLISCQGYTAFDHVWLYDNLPNTRPERYETYKSLFDKGRFVGEIVGVGKVTKPLPKISTFDELLDTLGKDAQGFSEWIPFKINPPNGWEFFDFNVENKNERQKAYEMISQDFELTDEEHKNFKTWF